MDVKLLESIVKLMRVNDLNEVDLRDGDKRVMMKRGAAFVQVPRECGPDRCADDRPAAYRR